MQLFYYIYTPTRTSDEIFLSLSKHRQTTLDKIFFLAFSVDLFLHNIRVIAPHHWIEEPTKHKVHRSICRGHVQGIAGVLREYPISVECYSNHTY